MTRHPQTYRELAPKRIVHGRDAAAATQNVAAAIQDAAAATQDAAAATQDVAAAIQDAAVANQDAAAAILVAMSQDPSEADQFGRGPDRPEVQTRTWIQRRNRQRDKWMYWRDVDLTRESLQSVFEAAEALGDWSELRSLMIMVERPDSTVQFRFRREDLDAFEESKGFMRYVLEVHRPEVRECRVWIFAGK